MISLMRYCPCFTHHYNDEAIEMSVNRITTTVYESEEIASLIEKERNRSHLLGVNVLINGVECYAMVDQGCTGVIGRDSFVNVTWPHAPHHRLPRGSKVTGSTGTEVSMPTAIKVDIQIGKTIVKDMVMYIVDDGAGQDICADIVLGKSFLSRVNAVCNMNTNKMVLTSESGSNECEVIDCIPSKNVITLRGDKWCTELQPLPLPQQEVVATTIATPTLTKQQRKAADEAAHRQKQKEKHARQREQRRAASVTAVDNETAAATNASVANHTAKTSITASGESTEETTSQQLTNDSSLPVYGPAPAPPAPFDWSAFWQSKQVKSKLNSLSLPLPSIDSVVNNVVTSSSKLPSHSSTLTHRETIQERRDKQQRKEEAKKRK